jgi:hypothetical protein
MIVEERETSVQEPSVTQPGQRLAGALDARELDPFTGAQQNRVERLGPGSGRRIHLAS